MAFAQNEEEQDSVTVMLDELVISANKIPEMKSKLAQQVFTLSAAQIININAQTSADLISSTGTVAIQKSQQGGGSPQLRGFEASRVLLVVDGVRMNNLIYRAGHLQNIITVDNSMLERAEILFGPSSTVYGSDALGGVIHFKTKEVQLSDDSVHFKANAFIRYSSVNEEKTGHVGFNIGGSRFGGVTSFTYSDFNDLKMGKRTNASYGEPFGLRTYYVERLPDNSGDALVTNSDPYVQKFSGYSQYDIMQKFLFKQSGAISHSVNFQYSTSSNIPRYDRLTDQDAATGLRNAEWYYGPQDRFMTVYQLSLQDLSKAFDDARLTISYQAIEESRYDRRFNRPNKRNQVENIEVWGATLDLSRSWPNHQLRYGFDGQFNTVKSTAFNLNATTGERSPAGTRYPDGNNSLNHYAIYATHTYDFNTKLVLNEGLRIGLSKLNATFNDKTFFPFPFDRVDQKNTYASGNLGLIYRPFTRWKLSTITSTGYRVPNIDDLAKIFDTNAGTSLIVPNPDVKPEKTLNVDFGITRYLTPAMRWEVTGYHTWFFDAIVLDRFTFNGQPVVDYDGIPTRVYANQNKRRAYIRGLSTVLQGDLSASISATATFNYTYGRIKADPADAPLGHIPPAFGRVGFRYHKNSLDAEAFVNYNGWKRLKNYFRNGEDNEVYATPEGMPSWYTVNLKGTYNVNKYLTLQAGVDNLLDLQYRTFSSGISAPGRNFTFTIRGQL